MSPPTEELQFAAGVWAAVAFAISFLFKKWWMRIAFVVVVVAIPFWELPYGYYNFAALCREEAKLKVFEPIPPQEKLCLLSWDNQMADLLFQAGYARVEVVMRPGYPKPVDGERITRIHHPRDATSTYCIDYVRNVRLPWRVFRNDLVVIGAKDARPVARRSNFVWLGMYWQEAIRPLANVGGYCFSDPYGFMRTLREGTGQPEKLR